MRFISSFERHPEVRRERFVPELWPRGQTEQEIEEGWFLLEFLEAAGRRIDTAPQNLAPPMPDVACTVAGERTLFELGEIIESNLAEGLAFSEKQSRKKAEALASGNFETARSIQTIQTTGFRHYSANGALERMLRQKLAKRYLTQGCPAELLLFFDMQQPWGPFEYLLLWKKELATLIESSVFRTVWVFWLQASTVIGRLRVHDGELDACFGWEFHFDPTAPFEAVIPSSDGRPDQIKRFVPVRGRTKP